MGPGADGFARHSKMIRPDGSGSGPGGGRDQGRGGGDAFGLRERIIVAGDERPSVRTFIVPVHILHQGYLCF
jgi:hypothetical protein